MNLNQNNCTVDKETGAVIFHKSPELQETLKLQTQVKELNTKVDKLESKIDFLIDLLKGGTVPDGSQVAKSRLSQNNDQQVQ